MQELPRIAYFITHSLGADAELSSVVGARIYLQTAPQAANETQRASLFPYVLATYQSALDNQGITTERTMTRALYQIAVCYVGAPNANIYKAADRIDEVIGKAGAYQLTINSESWVFDGRRESPINLTQLDQAAGIYYERLGGLYRINAYRGV